MLEGNLFEEKLSAARYETAVGPAWKGASGLAIFSQPHIGVGEETISRAKPHAVQQRQKIAPRGRSNRLPSATERLFVSCQGVEVVTEDHDLADGHGGSDSILDPHPSAAWEEAEPPHEFRDWADS